MNRARRRISFIERGIEELPANRKFFYDDPGLLQNGNELPLFAKTADQRAKFFPVDPPEQIGHLHLAAADKEAINQVEHGRFRHTIPHYDLDVAGRSAPTRRTIRAISRFSSKVIRCEVKRKIR
ncbi:MAG: hypothetical protein MPW15_27830 [Candidatus Manganitrophus sp.]|nr:hypothetical protein [Candidatus Manganitrophus sp.]